MMKLRQSLKSLARAGLNFLIIALLFCGCSSSTTPTYKASDIEKAIQDICRNEYKVDVVARRASETLWVYIPVEDLFTRPDKPEKYTERYEISEANSDFEGKMLNIRYAIKAIAKSEKFQEVIYNKKAMEKADNVWKALRRVVFSMGASESAGWPKFFCIVTADIKNGFETEDLFYYLDLKKVSYGFISPGEFHHRSVQDTNIDPGIIGDTKGKHVNYRQITMEEFIAGQIRQRIKLKFQKPEVKENADIDKEIEKAVYLTFDIYKFGDFREVDIYNALTKNRVILNRAAVLAGGRDHKS